MAAHVGVDEGKDGDLFSGQFFVACGGELFSDMVEGCLG